MPLCWPKPQRSTSTKDLFVIALPPTISITLGPHKLASLPYAPTSLNSPEPKLWLINAWLWPPKQHAMLLKMPVVLLLASGKREQESASKAFNGRRSSPCHLRRQHGIRQPTICKERPSLEIQTSTLLSGPCPSQVIITISSCSHQETSPSGLKLWKQKSLQECLTSQAHQETWSTLLSPQRHTPVIGGITMHLAVAHTFNWTKWAQLMLIIISFL